LYKKVKPEIRLNGIENTSLKAQKTFHATIAKTKRLNLFGEIIAVYSENHTEHKNTLRYQKADWFLLSSWCKQ
jgi:F0F1-type ATP synthase delta subunit